MGLSYPRREDAKRTPVERTDGRQADARPRRLARRKLHRNSNGEAARRADIFNPALEALIAYLNELDAKPPDHLTPPAIAQRLKSAPDRASLRHTYRAILRRLNLAMVRGHLAEIRTNEELMARLDAEAARTLRGTGRSPRGAVLDALADILERENQDRAEEEDDDV